MNTLNKLTYVLILSLVFVGFISCKDKPIQSKKSVNKKIEKKTVELPHVKSPPVVQKKELKIEHEIYIYDPKGRRDPFLSLIEKIKKKSKVEPGAPPIQSFDVDEIKVIAIMWDSQQYYAMITLPDNKSFTIRRGMTLGLYGGKVEEITANSVRVREQVKDYKGQLQTKDTLLKLRQEEEE